MDNIILIGAAGHANGIIDIIEKEGKYNIAGFIDKKENIKDSFSGYPILVEDIAVEEISQKYDVTGGIIAIGDNWLRSQVSKKIHEIYPKFIFVTTVHPSASLGRNVSLGEGTVIMQNAVVGSNTKIGKHCFVSANASIDHDCLADDYSSLAPGVTVGGHVSIGTFTAIGLGANVIHDIKIGAHTIIGAGSMVNKDITDHKMAYGVPAKEIRDREDGEKYL